MLKKYGWYICLVILLLLWTFLVSGNQSLKIWVLYITAIITIIYIG